MPNEGRSPPHAVGSLGDLTAAAPQPATATPSGETLSTRLTIGADGAPSFPGGVTSGAGPALGGGSGDCTAWAEATAKRAPRMKRNGRTLIISLSPRYSRARRGTSAMARVGCSRRIARERRVIHARTRASPDHVPGQIDRHARWILPAPSLAAGSLPQHGGSHASSPCFGERRARGPRCVRQ